MKSQNVVHLSDEEEKEEKNPDQIDILSDDNTTTTTTNNDNNNNTTTKKNDSSDFSKISDLPYNIQKQLFIQTTNNSHPQPSTSISHSVPTHTNVTQNENTRLIARMASETSQTYYYPQDRDFCALMKVRMYAQLLNVGMC